MRETVQIALMLVLGAAPLAAQVPQSPPDTTRRDTVASQGTAPAWHELRLRVVFPDGRAIAGATAVATPTDSLRRGALRVAVSDNTGWLTFDSLQAGMYDLRITRSGSPRSVSRRVSVDGLPVDSVVITGAPEPSLWWVLLLLVLYGGSILLARWHNIARSIHAMLWRQLTAVETRLDTEVDTTDARVAPLKSTVNRLKKEFEPSSWELGGHAASRSRTVEGLKEEYKPSSWGSWVRSSLGRIWEFLFWSRGRENAAWVGIHEVERQLAAALAPPEYVDVYLRWADAQLQLVATPPALKVAESIRSALEPPGAGDTVSKETREKTKKALLGQAIAIICEKRDTSFSTLMEWHNKSSWLIVAALLIIAFLAAAVGNAVLFLAGAAGGFLSRVMRALKREDVPLDYGASWTTLFLSPLFGALVAWFGVALIELATNDNVNLLGGAFNIVEWYDPTSPAALAVAFLLGFSERFFDAVAGALEKHAAGVEAAQQAAQLATRGQPASQTPARSAGGPPAGQHAPAAGLEVKLADGPITPVQVVAGKVVLGEAADSDVLVTLSSSHAEFEPTPRSVTIPKGKTEADFDLVPKGNPVARRVEVTAQAGAAKGTDSVDYR